ncbi:predicted coding region [Mycoplasmopsis pulmonis]|uniref:Uncharacterized protein n=1 Tax=Mycoplasmopsis pulmonis (strain UAB CTIP) TaxID=272635 RepID=Q98R34_MYCPU|nr:hypothetical protein [Mycoplasmopsis pulmonis]CAC13349.1 predicted coding region [Mycoplasmopsis pulmonis]VEU67940.1 Uncharacterised protein [Mycoplasmopsis pulmonis]
MEKKDKSWIWALGLVSAVFAIIFVLVVGYGTYEFFIKDFQAKVQKKIIIPPLNKAPKIQYESKVTGIKYETFSHGQIDGVDQFFFTQEELEKVDKEIFEKLSFGPEIFALRKISFNDTEVLDPKAKGQYIPITREIYVSVTSEADLNLSFEQKLAAIMPTIFHEYMHHFSNEYLKSGSEVNDKNTQLVDKTGEQNELTLWNRKFVETFQQALRYTDNQQNRTIISQNKSNPNFIGNYYSASDLYKIANSQDTRGLNSAIDEIPLNFKIDPRTHSQHFNKNFDRNFTRKEIQYYYSQEELVPREFQKIAYLPYYNSQKTTNPELKNEDDEFSQDGFGVLRKLTSSVTPNAFAFDWSRTAILNGNPTLHKNENVVLGDNFFLNNPYGGNIVSFKKDIYGSVFRTYNEKAFMKNTVNEFYNAFLEAMNYKSEISQLFVKNESNLESKSKAKVNPGKNNHFVRFTGFLTKEKAKKYKALVLTDEKGNIKRQSNLKFLTRNGDFTFKAKKNFNDTSHTLDPITSGYVTKDEEKVSYYTQDYIDLREGILGNINLDFNPNKTRSSLVYFWNDRNGDDQIQNDELEKPVVPNDLSREITTNRQDRTLENIITGKKDTYYIVNNNQGVRIVHK